MNRSKLGRPNDGDHRINHQRQSLCPLLRTIPRMSKRASDGGVLSELCDVAYYANIGIAQCVFYRRSDGLYVPIQEF